ncbi:uncharacterized protein An11g03300 [Aspergillus niger]|uniref:Contig An11c0140, genomic contig n=2 Tax=Aspergillus niger TaxID=5061 RepID=A5ABM1_ASPNC|nr:uncharacterized protein An11g03300 [Aspergillus niger]CAL00368.1 unnamed protein product [Aspergillus niger]
MPWSAQGVSTGRRQWRDYEREIQLEYRGLPRENFTLVTFTEDALSPLGIDGGHCDSYEDKLEDISGHCVSGQLRQRQGSSENDHHYTIQATEQSRNAIIYKQLISLDIGKRPIEAPGSSVGRD